MAGSCRPVKGGYPVNPFAPAVYIPFAVWMASAVYLNYRYNLRLPAGQITVLVTFWRSRILFPPSLPFNICLHSFNCAEIPSSLFLAFVYIC